MQNQGSVIFGPDNVYIFKSLYLDKPMNPTS